MDTGLIAFVEKVFVYLLCDIDRPVGAAGATDTHMKASFAFAPVERDQEFQYVELFLQVYGSLVKALEIDPDALGVLLISSSSSLSLSL